METGSRWGGEKKQWPDPISLHNTERPTFFTTNKTNSPSCTSFPFFAPYYPENLRLSHHLLLSEGAPPPFSYHPAGDRACQGDLCVLGASHLQDFCVLQCCALEGKIRQRVNKKSYPHPFLWPFKVRNLEFHRWYEKPLETTATIKGNNDRRDSEKCKCNHEWCFGQKSGLRWKIVDPINVKGQKANCMWQLL